MDEITPQQRGAMLRLSDTESAFRLISTVLFMEISEDWETRRVYLSMDAEKPDRSP